MPYRVRYSEISRSSTGLGTRPTISNAGSPSSKKISVGYWTTNIALVVFFVSLILAGVGKGMFEGGAFQQMMMEIRPFLMAFAVSGVVLMIGLWILLYHAFNLLRVALNQATIRQI